MSLRMKVLSFIAAAQRNPAQASNPEWLNALEADAFESLDGAYFAEAAPCAPFTWEQRTILLGAAPNGTSERIPFRFPYAVSILGFRSTVVPLQPIAAGIDPASVTGLATDVIDVLIDVNEQNNVTSANGITTPGGPNNGNFVTLSAVDVQAPRLTNIMLTGESPDMGFTFRWSLGPNVFADSLVKIAMFVRPLPGRGASWNVPDLPQYGRR